MSRTLVLMLLAAPLGAQSTMGVIFGRITDADGMPLAAAVHCEGWTTTTSVRAGSDANGRFHIGSVPPGTYRLRFSAVTYQAQEIRELEVPVAGYLEVSIRLRALNDVWDEGMSRALVLGRDYRVVNYYGPDVDFSRTLVVKARQVARAGGEATISTVIDPVILANLPLAGHDVYTGVIAQPATTSDLATGRGVSLSIAGQRPSSSSFLLDGFSNTNPVTSGPLALLTPEAVQEYRVTTNHFAPEYGGTAGLLANAVSRAGSAAWHGQTYAYLQHEAFTANDFQRNATAAGRLQSRRADAGLHLGGPLLPSRLFGAITLDHLRNRGAGESRTYHLPGLKFITVARDAAANSPVARALDALLLAYPAPAIAGQTMVGSATFSVPNPADQTMLLTRFDYRPKGGGGRWLGRVIDVRGEQPDFVWTPYEAFVSGLVRQMTSVGLSWLREWGAGLAVEARVSRGASRLRLDRAHPEAPTLVSQDPAGEVTLPGSPSSYSFDHHDRNVEGGVSASWFFGRHFAKAGASVLWRRAGGGLTFGRDGAVVFASLPDAVSAVPMFSPTVYAGVSRFAFASGQTATPAYDHKYGVLQAAAFLQDSFRVTRRLTLNYGLRYENFGAPAEVGGPARAARVVFGAGRTLAESLAGARLDYAPAGAPLYPSARGSAGVRLGAVWSPAARPSLVFRGGWGMFYDRAYDNLWLNVANNNTILALATPKSLAGLDRASLLANRFTPDLSFNRLTAWDPNLRTPRVNSYFAGLAHTVGVLTVELNAAGSSGGRLITTDIVNRPWAELPGGSFGPVNPKLDQIAYRAGEGQSTYHGLMALASYRSTNLAFQAAYTWSHSIDNQSEPLDGDFFDLRFTANASPLNRPTSAFTVQFDPAVDRGNSDFDQRQNLVFFASWNLPWALRGWRVSALGAVRSGIPFTVFASPDFFSLIHNRPDVESEAMSAETAAPGGRTILNRSAFADPAPGVVGSLGRNSLTGPGMFSADLSLARTFRLRRLGESGRFTVRADGFNFLNHANLGNPVAYLADPDFGLARYGRQETSPGSIAMTPLRESARVVQIVLRVEF